MAKYLTQEWVDELRARVGAGPAQPGASASVQLVVTGGPDGDVRSTWMLEDGTLRDVRLESKPDADVVLTLGYADAVAVQRGELDPSVAFMQGRMKTAGDPGALLRVLPVTSSPEWRALRAALDETTEY